MENSNEQLKKTQDILNSQIEHNKNLWEDEQTKAKELFEQLRQESINNFEQARNNIQSYIEEVNNFNKSFQTHLKNQPFDFQSLYNVMSDYHGKQLALLSQASHKQIQKISEFQNKLVDFYEDKQTVVNNEINTTLNNTMSATKQTLEKFNQPNIETNKSSLEKE